MIDVHFAEWWVDNPDKTAALQDEHREGAEPPKEGH
jgi:hypothetical protein